MEYASFNIFPIKVFKRNVCVCAHVYVYVWCTDVQKYYYLKVKDRNQKLEMTPTEK